MLQKTCLACLLLFLFFPSAALADTTKPPVFVFIMDEFTGTSLEDQAGNLDSRRFPNLASLSKSATWYPMAATGADMTFRAVPSIWSGLSLDHAGTPEETLFSLLQNDYRLVQFEDLGPVQKLCAACPAPPGQAQKIDGIPVRGKDSQAASVRSTLGAIKSVEQDSGRPLLWTSHVVLPHAPYRFLPSGSQVPLSPSMQNPGVTEAKEWSPQRWPLTLSRKRFLWQAGFVDRIIGNLKNQLDKHQLWDESMVVITADHGSSWTPQTHRRYIEPKSFSQVANVPLIIKYPYQRQGKVDRGSAQLIDIAPTIASVTGHTLSWPSPGLSLLSRRPRRDISVFTAEKKEWVSLPFRSFARSRRSSVRSWNRLFPRGADAWIGPAPSLRGISVQRFRRNRSAAFAQIELKETFRRVRPGSGWLPAVLGAQVFGLDPGDPVAVSINGRVVASGYTYLDNQSALRVNIPLPEKAIKQGSNRVELWSISSGLKLLDSTAGSR